jgi:CRISPR system Cascade subunit CasB
MKPLRFRRLMEAETPDERLTAFRRLVALAGGRVNVRNLAAALLAWNEDLRTRWIYDYWNAGQLTAAPQAEETST